LSGKHIFEQIRAAAFIYN